MGISTIILLILSILVGIYSLGVLSVNISIVNLDLLFLELDLQLGYVILSSVLLGIMITLLLEIIYFSSKRKKKNE